MLGKDRDKTNGSTYDVYRIGEQIRSHMHRAGLIKDRRYRLRKYRQCFVGREAVDWLVKMCHAQSRGEAVMAMRILQENGMMHHVTDDHVFKDQSLYFRFSRDDDSYMLRSDLTAFYRGLEVFNAIKNEDIRREFYHRGHLYQDAFYGCDLVDCLISRDPALDRTQVIVHCRELLEFDIIRHVTDDYHFSDDKLMYQFHVEFERPCLLSDVLHQPDTSSEEHLTSVSTPSSPLRNASSSLDQPGPLAGSVGTRVDTHSVLSHLSLDSANHNRPVTSTTRTDNDLDELHGNEQSAWLARHEQVKDDSTKVLMTKRIIKLHQDEVGYGFVLRGSSPCYVHTVDPLGPAAAAGLREGQYLLSVDGESVQQYDHRQVGRLVMAHTGLLTLLVLAKTAPDH